MQKNPLFPDLSQRSNAPELMDDPGSDKARLEKTLAQFSLINRWLCRVRNILKHYVVRRMEQEPSRSYHLIDLGAGACETAAWLLNYARGRGLKLRVTACDHDPRVVDYAIKRYGKCQGLTILQRSVLELEDLSPVDFVFANHLLHHLNNTEINELLLRLSKLNPGKIVISDIRRSLLVYAGYYLLTCFLPIKSFAKFDGLLSIRKGFRVEELQEFAEDAGLSSESFRIETMFPGRIVLIHE